MVEKTKIGKTKKEDDDAPEVAAGWDDWEEPDADAAVSDRPTVTPPFDLETYAKEKSRNSSPSVDTSPSDTAITVAPPAAAFPPQAAKRSSQNLLAFANANAPSVPPDAPHVEGDEGSALDLVAKRAVPHTDSTKDPVTEMQERFALGDYSGALVIAESMLEDNPGRVEAREYAESCRSVLMQMYEARIGALDRVPLVEVQREQLRWLSIDHRAGFVLSLVDGVSSFEMILDVSGMPRIDALRILYELVQQRVISLR